MPEAALSAILSRSISRKYFFCGHIHEAEGVVIQMGATRAQNVGKKGYLLEL